LSGAPARWWSGHLESLQHIAPLAWPVLVGQLAVLAFSTVDTVLLARHSAIALAALAVGSAVYITVFVGLMGVVLAVSPVVGQLFGAGSLREAGESLHQSIWLALALSVLGEIPMLWPEPFLAIAQTEPAVEAQVRSYLLALGASLPAALVFTAYRGFNTAVSRPKVVMALQLTGLALKIPLSTVLIGGFSVASWQCPSLGALGCAIATGLVMWSQLLIMVMLQRRDPFYAKFGLGRGHGGFHAPKLSQLKALLKLGVPMGGSILIEVSGFTFMAIFIARLGATAVSGHQLAVNLISLLFMLPLSLANATGTLVAQRVGAREPEAARRLGWHGLEIALALSCLCGGLMFMLREQVLSLYTQDPTIIAAAMPLLLWVWIFHMGDAGQTMAAYVLRAHHVAVAPMVIYALAIWGLGLGGGYLLAFGQLSWLPQAASGARGFWIAATVGLLTAAIGLSAFLAYVHRLESSPSRGS